VLIGYSFTNAQENCQNAGTALGLAGTLAEPYTETDLTYFDAAVSALSCPYNQSYWFGAYSNPDTAFSESCYTDCFFYQSNQASIYPTCNGLVSRWPSPPNAGSDFLAQQAAIQASASNTSWSNANIANPYNYVCQVTSGIVYDYAANVHCNCEFKLNTTIDGPCIVGNISLLGTNDTNVFITLSEFVNFTTDSILVHVDPRGSPGPLQSSVQITMYGASLTNAAITNLTVSGNVSLQLLSVVANTVALNTIAMTNLSVDNVVINSWNPTNVTVADNVWDSFTCVDSTFTAIYMTNDVFSGNTWSNVLVANCTVYGVLSQGEQYLDNTWTDVSYSVANINAAQTSILNLTNNVVSGNSDTSISFNDVTVNNLVISGNVVADNIQYEQTWNGVTFTGTITTNNTFEGDATINENWQNVSFTDITFENCVFINTPYYNNNLTNFAESDAVIDVDSIFPIPLNWVCYDYVGGSLSRVDPTVSKPFKCFVAVCQTESQADAQSSCESINGTLAKIYTETDQTAVNQTIGAVACPVVTYTNYWLGGRRGDCVSNCFYNPSNRTAIYPVFGSV
jgi:hypothetical protein